MNRTRSGRSYLVYGLLAAALVAVPTLLAHSVPVKMTPAANSEVSAPANVTILFSEALEQKLCTIAVTDASGHAVTKEAASAGGDAKTMTVKLLPLSPGVYNVHWVAVATDTHRSQGDYKFTVK